MISIYFHCNDENVCVIVNQSCGVETEIVIEKEDLII